MWDQACFSLVWKSRRLLSAGFRVFLLSSAPEKNRASSSCGSVSVCIRTDDARYVHFQRENSALCNHVDNGKENDH